MTVERIVNLLVMGQWMFTSNMSMLSHFPPPSHPAWKRPPSSIIVRKATLLCKKISPILFLRRRGRSAVTVCWRDIWSQWIKCGGSHFHHSKLWTFVPVLACRDENSPSLRVQRGGEEVSSARQGHTDKLELMAAPLDGNKCKTCPWGWCDPPMQHCKLGADSAE